ncbi:hypothetical protein A2962_00585 [Candidatus Woesebacteria bacterium RIFCSPLOWO2_01_FULL_39_61]|uniref:SDR family oxidoreductase n=1 Tax=Candidatus Woesebacteria bacterium RIFCSPHIGHO2_02_FULL_39_13 TaxID=1802505 RepID=A0A1F7Z485_9BACT|nr:MAG: hypothetical protein A2692_04715 [Candidatus Woesebacteria bacterium RIFCSPHIGHO2_01_FULL_39_95]OGM33595.1 MAG: hypothetical protein A3D01_01410 [Candidatus Woesebacteria bacterium RIFCSPHIGHO2_02_FULL_39_13]OGM36675.1 MAG: hypothetical protein A3E13_00080 [Candidatus Woesebacteria bacterium RIFCSPHIGHO2_12_FULL_40_20]OGM68548.1 MAG: hypothetical protein A2962_00585 [Candidatus Woesebacteria bacterium RIFCSPLOWO2_01_FULL_39_61]OGM73433.1 MAG: hypothetical protein A3H19_00755 [Candidatus
MQLKNRVVLITGASGGIGKTIARKFARKGCRLILHSKDKATIEGIRKELCDKKTECISVSADFRKLKEIKLMFDEIRKTYSSLDVIVNVSGVERIYTDPLDTHQWKEVMDVNLFGAVECSREALRMMNGGGVIINISSVAGKPGVAYYGESLSYSISKSALNTFSENLAIMLAPRIRVVSISPGHTLTPMWNLSSEKEKKEYEERVPLKRFITPQEIAHAVIAVAENDAITGTNIVVDAGLSLKEIR